MTGRVVTVRRGLALLVLSVVAVAGCGSDDVAELPGPTTPTESVADTTPATDTPLPDTSGPDTSASDSAEPNSTGTLPEGFTTVQALITDPDGETCEVCLWLADDGTERGRGLMGVTDLGDAVGMVFRFEEPTRGSFYMFQTPTPLSIAWFSPDGDHVGSAEMAPCLDTAAGDCPLYSPDGEYDLAVEVFEGGLEPLGLVAGSRLELIEGSEADGCPLSP
jgi:uncharacterized membrane protein (UPF0127 family)